MKSINRALTELALDPFAVLLSARDGQVQLGGQAFAAAELRAALAAPDPALAGDGWASCDTCSDPGTDEHDPFRAG